MLLHTEIYGIGKPVVLIHGWAMHSGIWRKFARQLSAFYQVICVDLPGHGRSIKETPFTLENISEQIKRILPNEPCCVLGWSLGATIAVDLAQRFPEKIAQIILLAGNPHFVKTETWHGMKPNVFQQFAQNLMQDTQATLIHFLSLQVFGLANYADLLTELTAIIQETPPPDLQTLQEGLILLKDSDLRETLSELKCPIAVILGSRDTLIPVAVGQQMQQLQPALTLQIIDKAGHVPFLSHPTLLLNTITQWIGLNNS